MSKTRDCGFGNDALHFEGLQALLHCVDIPEPTPSSLSRILRHELLPPPSLSLSLSLIVLATSFSMSHARM